MEDQPKEACFMKKLTTSDVDHGLEIPNDAQNLPKGEDIMFARDGTGREWKFKAYTRKKGGRRFMGNGWRNFVKDAAVKKGQKLTYYRMKKEFYLYGKRTSPNVYYVKLQR